MPTATVTRPAYYAEAFTTHEAESAGFPWDMTCESVSETVMTVEDARDAWRLFKGQYDAATGQDRRFAAWALVYVEQVAARLAIHPITPFRNY